MCQWTFSESPIGEVAYIRSHVVDEMTATIRELNGDAIEWQVTFKEANAARFRVVNRGLVNLKNVKDEDYDKIFDQSWDKAQEICTLYICYGPQMAESIMLDNKKYASFIETDFFRKRENENLMMNYAA